MTETAPPPAEPPAAAGQSTGATGMFTVTLVKPEPGRPVAEHWAYDARGDALADLGLIVDRVAPGTELVLRDPSGQDLLRIAKLA